MEQGRPEIPNCQPHLGNRPARNGQQPKHRRVLCVLLAPPVEPSEEIKAEAAAVEAAAGLADEDGEEESPDDDEEDLEGMFTPQEEAMASQAATYVQAIIRGKMARKLGLVKSTPPTTPEKLSPACRFDEQQGATSCEGGGCEGSVVASTRPAAGGDRGTAAACEVAAELWESSYPSGKEGGGGISSRRQQQHVSCRFLFGAISCGFVGSVCGRGGAAKGAGGPC